MRQPLRKDKYARRILTVANKDKSEQEKILRFVELINEVAAKNPFMPSAQQNKLVMKNAIDEGCDDLEAERCFRAASQIVVPFLSSGEKYARADALIDALVDMAEKHLMEDVYSKDGMVVGQRFSANTMNAMTKAIGIKMQTLTKIQANLISAQKESGADKESKDFDINSFEKDQLERFISGELMENPEIVQNLISRHNTQDQSIKNFHEVVDDNEST